MDGNTIVQFVKLTQKGNEEKLYSLKECYAHLFAIEEHLANLRKILELYGAGPLVTPNISVRELEGFLTELMSQQRKHIVSRLNEIRLRTDEGYAIDINIE